MVAAEYASTHYHYVVVYVLYWGRGGQHLAQVAFIRLCVWPWGLFMKVPARVSNLSSLNP